MGLYLNWRFINLGLLMGVFVCISPQALEESISKLLLEEVHSAKEKYVTYPVEFVLYSHKDNKSKRITSTLAENGKIHRGELNSTASIKILVHGWQHKFSTDFEHLYWKAFNGTVRNVQVIAVRWKEAKRDYVGARRAVPGVAQQVTKYLERLEKDYGVNTQRINFFGHGLGAQICGAVGHQVGGRLNRIIAMDPAMPLFWQNTHDSVNKSSARKVIGVHTSAGTFGVIWNVGHADFWSMDGMAPQLPCRKLKSPESQLRCSHEQAYQYFLESIKFRGAILASTCGRKYVCKPEVFKIRKALLMEHTKAVGQYCFVPPKKYPWPSLKDILISRNLTEEPPITEETLAPGVTEPTEVTSSPGITLGPNETLAPGQTLPPGASTILPTGVTSDPGKTSSDPEVPIGDCDAMIRRHRQLLHGSRALTPERKLTRRQHIKIRSLLAEIKKCENFESKIRRISKAYRDKRHLEKK